MKINYLLLLFFIFIRFVGFSQDKIVTIKNDTIDCKIKKIGRKAIYFDLNVKNVKSSGELPLSEVSRYIVDTDIPVRNEVISEKQFIDQRYRLSLGGGAGYIFTSTKNAEQDLVSAGLTNDQAKSYYNNLRLGYIGTADFTYFIAPDYGIGLKYKFFETSNSLEAYLDPNDGYYLIYGNLAEKIYVNFFGATFYSQQWIAEQQRLKFNSTLAFGLAAYRDESDVITSSYLITGKCFAADANLGLEYFIGKNISIGVDLSAFYCSFRKLKVSDGTNVSTVKLDKDNYENISRIDLSFGIKIYR